MRVDQAGNQDTAFTVEQFGLFCLQAQLRGCAGGDDFTVACQ